MIDHGSGCSTEVCLYCLLPIFVIIDLLKGTDALRFPMILTTRNGRGQLPTLGRKSFFRKAGLLDLF